MRYAIFDLDGCLSDDRWRRHLIPHWSKYHEGITQDKPINIDVLNGTIQNGLTPLIITARPIKYRVQTIKWLEQNMPSSFLDTRWRLLMRPKGNDQTSKALKEGLVENWEEISVAFDDREEIVEMYKSHGVDAHVLKAPDKTASDILMEGAKTHAERSEVYGKNYEVFGKVASALWPDGLTLKTESDFIRHGIFVQCLSKITRYANSEKGHKDSAHDLMVYAAMLEEVTE
jgi:hypothetical protein